jgi:DNA polymerase-3 subunit alpha
MTFDMDKTEKLANHMQEASRLGIPMLPPDVNRSSADFRVEKREDGTECIRFALAAVKRVGLQAMKDLVAARDRPFESVADFAGRVDPKLLNKMQLENLARAGAFDTLEKNRAKVMTGAEVILRRAQAKAEERSSSQIGLFGGGDARPEPLRLPEIPDWPELERLSHEAEAVGFHLSAHPLDTYKDALRKLGATPIAQAQLRAEAGVGRLKLAGTVVNSKERTTRTGSRMAWVRISDSSGSTEVTLFSEVLLRSREMLKEGNAVLITCEARMEGETLRLTAQDLEGLDKAAAGLRQILRLTIEDVAAIDPIRALLEREGPGKGKVALIPRTGPGQEIEVLLPGLFNVSPRMAQAMKVVPGVAHVEAG